MPTFFWAKTRQIRGADTPRGRNVPGKEAAPKADQMAHGVVLPFRSATHGPEGSRLD